MESTLTRLAERRCASGLVTEKVSAIFSETGSKNDDSDGDNDNGDDGDSGGGGGGWPPLAWIPWRVVHLRVKVLA